MRDTGEARAKKRVEGLNGHWKPCSSSLRKAEPSGTTLVDARNGFNELSRLTMLWVVCHRWPAGLRFAFNCYRCWVQIILLHPSDALVILLIREGVTQGEPLSMVLYGITLVLLEEELRDVDPTLISPFYDDDAAFDGLLRQNMAQLRLLV